MKNLESICDDAVKKVASCGNLETVSRKLEGPCEGLEVGSQYRVKGVLPTLGEKALLNLVVGVQCAGNRLQSSRTSVNYGRACKSFALVMYFESQELDAAHRLSMDMTLIKVPFAYLVLRHA
ncbi:hypothetical protein O6H91_22G049600 [Diphasiastrum complanatum]|uniref:Uncharacterized protein n=1 Tax=Diphasiastrum complanatum TaxID=34168 RepID=A0ACC2AFA8_DIPCM|nr:hypothetical protein O6H91_22G049600 [Diphasiastrum complanatum]